MLLVLALIREKPKKFISPMFHKIWTINLRPVISSIINEAIIEIDVQTYQYILYEHN